VLAERHDLAFGTSRWSSKLVHGGLRYLAQGDVVIAYESAVERGLIMTTLAPHLCRALPMMLPWLPGQGRRERAAVTAGLMAGGVLRRMARTTRRTLPRGRRLTGTEMAALVPGLRRDVTGGVLSWDGQLTDDARLVVAVARTAAASGARILTRCEAANLTGEGAVLTDRLTGASIQVRAAAVINATGVWAGQLVPGVRLRPSRGTHLVLPGELLPGLAAGVFIPVPGERGRFAFALPVPGERRVYVGITDEPAPGPPADEPQPSEQEITFLLGALGNVLDAEIGRASVIGAFAGLRPLRAGRAGRTADLSRRHAVLTTPDGVITVVGGKLTTYRRMAQDAVDAALRNPALALARAGRAAGPCRTRAMPLAGAAGPDELARVRAPGPLVARYGTEAPRVLGLAAEDPSLAEPVADGLAVTGADLVFALRHEGALDEADLMDRRTRIGLVPADAARARPAVARILAAHGGHLESA
jgi:glycerol-3-phosphate dehydrogenase